MISFVILIVVLVIFGGMALLALGVIGGTVAVAHKVLTSPTAQEAAQVKRDLEGYYRRMKFDRAEEMYSKLPNWAVTKQLRSTAAIHHGYQRKLIEATNFFGANHYGLADRVQESSTLFSNYADLAGRIVALSGHVNGSERRLEAQCIQDLGSRTKELHEIAEHVSAMQLEVQKSLMRQDPYAGQAISDSLAQQYAQLRAVNTTYQEHRRIAGDE